MSKYYKNLMLGATRIHSIENIKAWIKAEENLGLHKSIFITIDGVTIQYYDVDEGENFFEWVKKICSNGVIENWFRRYFEALKEKDKIKQFECLAIFHEIDEHPEIASDDIHRRLKRVRESTHEEIYK